MADSIGKFNSTPRHPDHQLTIDRVFFKAILTIRALLSRLNYGTLPRPPAESRIKLYGLYKQATEGDVDGVMPRPVGFTAEDEGAKKKWDAWKRELGVLKTEAKRRYIAYLIETMKVYALGTPEARELLAELEYLWDQIKDLPDEELVVTAPHHDYPLPPRLPSFSQYLGGTNLVYRNNLQRIYSHLRRLIALDDRGFGGLLVPPLVYHLAISQAQPVPGPQQPQPQQTLEDFRNWQREMNVVVNKLTREYVHQRRHLVLSGRGSPEDDVDAYTILQQRLRRWGRAIAISGWRLFKSFSLSVLAVLFVVWCLKKNVKVKRTVVTLSDGGRSHKELVINMVVLDENKWFLRLLRFMNMFVGFV